MKVVWTPLNAGVDLPERPEVSPSRDWQLECAVQALVRAEESKIEYGLNVGEVDSATLSSKHRTPI
jgi:hypothetical protein